MEDPVAAVFPQQIPIAVSQEPPGAGTIQEKPFLGLAARRHFQRTDGALHVAQAHVLCPKLGRDVDGHTGCQRQRDHFLVHAFCVHVDFHAPSASCHTVENGFPELIAPLGNPAFAVDPECHPANRRARPEERV